MPRILFLILLTGSLTTFAFTQEIRSPAPAASPPVEEQTPASKVDQLFAQWDKPDTPGCALGVLRDRQIVYRRNYGMADLELGVPISNQSVFNVGSVSKQFTAMSILMLAHQGKLSLDDKLTKYVPEAANVGAAITLRHLLQHTSGLRDHFEMLEMTGWRTTDVHTEQNILDMVARQKSLNFQPGEEYSYSNTGYVLLAVIIKRVTGQTLREFAAANIFIPLGMTMTNFYDDHRAVVRNHVKGYLTQPGGGFRRGESADDFLGSGGIHTTIEDLARWDQNFYDKKIGGKDLLEQMIVPAVLNDGEKLEYAYGLFVNSYKGLKTISHSGSRIGYRAELVRFPEQHLSVALMCNVRAISPDALARRVAEIYLSDQFPKALPSQNSPAASEAGRVKVSAGELSSVAGLYWNPLTDNLRRIYVKDGKLFFFRAQGNESELAPLGANRFLMLNVRNRIEIDFKTPRAGAPLQMLLSIDGGKPSPHERVQEVSYTAEQLKEFAGEYYSEDLDATYSLIPQGLKVVLRAKKWADFTLSPRFTDSFADPENFGSLTLTRDSRGRVNGFVVRSGKVKNLRFSKLK
jgi:CubicO group peptidase (beta-lactamase class C family)